MSRKHTPSTEARDLHALLTAVLEAVTLPYDSPDYDQRILKRAALARSLAGAALAEKPADLGWDIDYLRKQLAQEQAEADEREKSRCQRCLTEFDSGDTRFDGRGRHAETPWCRACVDNCHDGGTEHACIICDPARYGGDPR